MEYKYYIAYGSNINNFQMSQRCPDSKIIGISFLNDYKLLFKGPYSRIYLTIEKSLGSKIPVLVWKTSAIDEKTLDIYEDYPNLYYKDEMEIEVKSIDSNEIKTVKAYVYKMQKDYKVGLPTKIYYDTVLKGYEEMNFDKSILEIALNESKNFINN